MIPNRVFLQTLLKKKVPNLAFVNQYSTERDVFGTREWVGYGMNGSKHYIDRKDCPMPAIRWKEIKGDLASFNLFLNPEQWNPVILPNPMKLALKEKEKGDWKKLTIDERKALYRASFCQTFAEFEGPTGEWKYVLGGVFTGLAITIFYFTLIKLYAGPPLPASFSEENRAKQLRAYIDLRYGVGTGVYNKWDYEKDDWKK